MDTQTIDQEFEKLQTEFQDVAKTVQGLAEKMQAAEKAGDANATEWLGDLKQVAQDIDDEQTQAQGAPARDPRLHQQRRPGAAPAAGPTEKPPLFAPGQEPAARTTGPAAGAPTARITAHVRRDDGGGMMGGGMFGGGMMGGYYGGGFGRAMEMGMGMSLGANLIGSIFR